MSDDTKAPKPFKERRKQPLRNAVYITVTNYLADLDGHAPGNLHEMMVKELEHGLFTAVLEHTRGNQSKAAELLGINRSTLRKKLRLHGLLE